MKDAEINYEYETFELKIEKEGSNSRITSLGINILELPTFIKELSNKKLKIEDQEILFSTFLEENQEGPFSTKITVTNPENILELEDKNILVKNPAFLLKEIKQAYLDSFSYAQDYEGYKEFISFLKKSLEGDLKVTLDEEFPGTMLKFYKQDTFFQAVSLHEETITFIESFSEEYKKLQLENIKETLEKINHHLQLEGKKPLSLGKL